MQSDRRQQVDLASGDRRISSGARENEPRLSFYGINLKYALHEDGANKQVLCC